MILAIDQGTTGSTCLVFDREGRIAGRSLQRVPPALPAAGLGRARRGRDLGRDAARRRRGDRRRRHPGRAARRDRDHEPARDRRRLGSGHRRARPPRARLAGPAHGRPLPGAARPGPRGPGPRADGPGARPLLLRHQDRVARAQRRGRAEGRRLRHDRLLARLQADRPPRHRLLERVADAPVRHPLPPLGRGALRPARRGRGPPAGAAAVGDRLRHHLRVRRRDPGRRDRGRSAGGAVRTGVPPSGRRQEHLRDRQLRAPERRHRGAARARGAPDDGRLGRRGRGGLCARGRDLRHRRRRPVASRRPRHPRRRRRDGADGGVAGGQRRRLFRPCADRPRLAPLGPLRAGHVRRADPGDDQGALRPSRAGGDRLPDRRRRARPGGRGRREPERAARRRRRRRQPLADAVPGRRARRCR